MKRPKRNVLIGVLLLLLLGGFLAFEILRKPSPAQVSVTYLGYTNHLGQGMRPAFAVTNNGKDDIRRPAGHTTMQSFQRAQLGLDYPEYPDVDVHVKNTLISPGQVEVFTIGIPGDQGPWRASVAVYEDGLRSKFIKLVDHYWIGSFLPESFRGVPLEIVHSDWVEIGGATEPDASPEPPSAVPVLEASEAINHKPENEAPAASGGR